MHAGLVKQFMPHYCRKRYLLLLMTYALCMPVLFTEQRSWFSSNSIGMAFERILESDATLHEWYAVVYSDSRGEDIIRYFKELYRNGEIYRIWWKDYKQGNLMASSEIKGDYRELAEFTDGRIMRTTVTLDNALQEEWIHFYTEEGLPSGKKRTYPAEDTLHIAYLVEPSGRLRSRYLHGPDGSYLTIQGISGNRYLKWISGPGMFRYETYTDGRLALEETLGVDGVQRWNYSYHEDGFIRTGKSNGFEHQEYYNRQGKLLRKIINDGARRVYLESVSYDDDGVSALSRLIIEKDLRIDWKYFYLDNRIETEKKFVNRRLVLRREYQEETMREYHYRQDRLSHILSYDSDGLLIQTETAPGGNNQ